MPATLEITHQDDTPLSLLTLIAERGIPSDVIDLKIKNTGIVDVVGAYLTLYAETAPGSGVYVSYGQPVVDERQGRFQITGQDSSATPGQQVILDVVQPMGHLAVGLMPTILPGDWILANFWIEQAGASAGGGAITFKIEVANDRAAHPLSMGVSWVGTGIASGRKQGRSFIITNRATVASGPPDDNVNVDVGSWILNGEEYSDVTPETLNFNQDDGAASALVATESYIAAITQGVAETPVVTKGLKGNPPVKPTPPSGELILAWVTVVYNAVASVIQQTDIESDLTYGRYLVEAPPTGLNAIVHSGEAIINDFAQVRALKGPILLVAASTNRIWLTWSGGIAVTQNDDLPSPGAIKLAIAITDATDITSLQDTRVFIPIHDLFHETPVGVIDGANVDFTIGQSSEGMLVKNGVVQHQGIDFDRVGTTLTYLTGTPTGGDQHLWFRVG